MSASRVARRSRGGATGRRRVALLVAAAGLLVVSACSAARADGGGSTAARAAVGADDGPSAGVNARWFAFAAGRARPISGPDAASASFAPWTVQTHAAGLLSIGSTLYIAVNGWGLLALPHPAAVLTAGGASFRGYEKRRLFAERTINGFTVDSGRIVIHLYRNTVFATKAPNPKPVTYVRLDLASHTLKPVALQPSIEGWEAAGVVTTATGSWAMAWKKTRPQRVEFRYSMFDPADGSTRTIDRSGFLAAYDFVPIPKAPNAVRRLSGIAAALEAPQGSAGTGYLQVVHFLLRGEPFARTRRYSEGPERELATGDAALVTVRAVRAGERVYALVSGGRLLRSGAGSSNPPAQKALLPALPDGYAYTDFWTDGRTIVASWEQQRFAQVGAAGLCIVAIKDLHWQEA